MILDYILRRLGLLLFMLLMLSIFTFSLAYLFPGDPLSNLSGVPSNNFSQNTQLEDKYFYNSNYFMQYLAFLGRVFQGDWGLSFASGDNVFSHILDLLPATLELSVYALIVSIFVGVPAGIIGSAYYNRWPDKLINSTTIVGYSMPVFWLALLLIMIFSLKLGWFPMSGRMGLLYEIPAASGFMLIDIMLAGFPYKGMAFVDALHHLTLPTIVLATYPTTVLVRFTRESMLKIMDQNFIKTARAKGLNRRQLIMHHALRNALLPVVTMAGVQVGALIGGSVIVESVFAWPGLGMLAFESLFARDLNLLLGIFLLSSALVVAVNLIVDVIYCFLDPRIEVN